MFLEYVESLYTSGLAMVILLTTPLFPMPTLERYFVGLQLIQAPQKTGSRACSFSTSSGSCCLCLISFMSYKIPFLFMDQISEVSHFMSFIPHTTHGVCLHRSESPIWMGASRGYIFLPKAPISSRLALSLSLIRSFSSLVNALAFLGDHLDPSP